MYANLKKLLKKSVNPCEFRMWQKNLKESKCIINAHKNLIAGGGEMV